MCSYASGGIQLVLNGVQSICLFAFQTRYSMYMLYQLSVVFSIKYLIVFCLSVCLWYLELLSGALMGDIGRVQTSVPPGLNNRPPKV